ncbi:LacI family DNA-binding transcriptional regulator [Aeoliella sp.]|uniref:LacI family DNA-binding transcriptional regulator n=1 Tax=Aeoliella sp. TaxID=2795800 RepID=UPI003CCBB890
MAATIEQIAKRAGVSASTVARVLRGDVKGVQKRSAMKSAEILRISDELGYSPDWRARALSRKRTHSIGLLYSNPQWIFEDPMNDIAVSFTSALQEQNYDLRLIPVTDSSDWRELVYGNAVDGLAFLLEVPEQAKEVVLSDRLPVVLLGGKMDDRVHVVPDDVSGGYMAARHLLGLGHKKIVFYIADTIRPHVSVDERRQGYEQAMAKAGLADQIAVWHCDTDEAMGRLLGPDAPTAMIGYCHVEALRISHAAWSHGLAIPTDLSLVAFNDMRMVECMTPPLTTVGFDTAELGRIGANLLVSQIGTSKEEKPSSVMLRQKLVVRGTTAPLSVRPSAGNTFGGEVGHPKDLNK